MKNDVKDRDQLYNLSFFIIENKSPLNCSSLKKKIISQTWITSSSYILHACKYFRKLKINSYVINKLFKLQVFVVQNYE